MGVIHDKWMKKKKVEVQPLPPPPPPPPQREISIEKYQRVKSVIDEFRYSVDRLENEVHQNSRDYFYSGTLESCLMSVDRSIDSIEALTDLKKSSYIKKVKKNLGKSRGKINRYNMLNDHIDKISIVTWITGLNSSLASLGYLICTNVEPMKNLMNSSQYAVCWFIGPLIAELFALKFTFDEPGVITNFFSSLFRNGMQNGIYSSSREVAKNSKKLIYDLENEIEQRYRL
jgi:hypothetical protein